MKFALSFMLSVASGLALLFRAVRFTAGYVRRVGLGPALSKCILLSIPAEIRKDMRLWVFV